MFEDKEVRFEKCLKTGCAYWEGTYLFKCKNMSLLCPSLCIDDNYKFYRLK